MNLGGSTESASGRATAAVAVVIPVLNEERNLGRLLHSIRIQDGVVYNVAVVDEGSTDRTQEIAREYGCLVVSGSSRGFYSPPGASRNIGAAAVPGNLLLHLDADMELGSSDFFSRLVSLVDDKHEAIVIHELDQAKGFWSKCKALERRCYWGSAMESPRAVSRRLFDAIGGYDADVSSGEDFSLRARCRPLTDVAAADGLVILHHTGRRTLRSLLAKKYQYGKTARTYLRKTRELQQGTNPAAGIIGTALASYLRSAAFLRKDPVHYMAIFPLRLLEFIALACGMAAGGRAGRNSLAASD